MTESTSTKNKVVFVLIPGSFCPPSYYDGVTRKLVHDGYENVQACDLPSVCKANEHRTPPATLYDDALYVREVIQGFLAKGKDIILIMSAYGGLPGTEAIKDLPSRSSINTIQGEGASGAVVGMIYLSSFLPHAGDNLRSLMGEMLFEPLKSGTPGGYMTMPAGAGRGIFNDWYAEGKDKEAEAAEAELIDHSSDAFDGKITYNLWSMDNFKGEVVYITGEVDVIFLREFRESTLEKVEKLVPGRVKSIQIKDGGHATHVTKPETVAGIIEDVATEIQK